MFTDEVHLQILKWNIRRRTMLPALYTAWCCIFTQTHAHFHTQLFSD